MRDILNPCLKMFPASFHVIFIFSSCKIKLRKLFNTIRVMLYSFIQILGLNSYHKNKKVRLTIIY